MKNLLRRLLHNILSIITTFILMASPVAAIIYISEPIDGSNDTIRNVSMEQEEPFLAKSDWIEKKVKEWEPDLLDDPIIMTLSKAREGNKNLKINPIKNALSWGSE
ncbi:hypothetical protein [Pelosinus sp. IPA-1]|uniref:hypothetical protein n=1 Tax=Pelosinus sp. IPA-1 TaxID=3029569 RepID=UPI0024362B68|nr:hypothetical protein [Pelosinus sp. IPA-1]GMB01807.1 hypothetical protein PIPA1_46070 [Pelosinus sp. IPA-1]